MQDKGTNMEIVAQDIMWKESYCIGVNNIDQEHRELFQLVKDLLDTVEDEQNWILRSREWKTEIIFLKNRILLHFQDEEEYQKSIGYSGYEAHKKLHEGFLKDLDDHETKMRESGFQRKMVKQFAGTIVSWLIYHVTEADQELADAKKIKETIVAKAFVKSIRETLETMVGLSSNAIAADTVEEAKAVGDVFVQIGLIGDIQGVMMYAFSKEFALEVVKQMTFMELTELDDMVCSAVAEISNISSGNATILLSQKGYNCDITPPTTTVGEIPEKAQRVTSGICIDSDAGKLSFAAAVDEEQQ